jgi:hypothetical protein
VITVPRSPATSPEPGPLNSGACIRGPAKPPSVLPMLGRAGLARPTRRLIVRAVLAALLFGFFIVRFAIRQYVRKELAWRTENQL